MWLVPALPGRRLPMDVLGGVLLSSAGIGLIVFGLQEGQRDSWSPLIGLALVGGVALLVAFFGWQAINPNEPLIPLGGLVRHRNFILSNAGIALVSFAFVAFVVPLMIFLEEAYGFRRCAPRCSPRRWLLRPLAWRPWSGWSSTAWIPARS